jgi:hypothetical protein
MVPYTEEQPPTNRYHHQIISPPRAGACCFSAMEWLDAPQQYDRGVFQYRRCRRCGFSVRVILREILDAALIASLRVG